MRVFLAQSFLGQAVLAQGADPDRIRRTTEQVLDQPEYQQVVDGQSLLDRAFDYALESLGRFLLQFDGDGGVGSVGGALIIVAIVLGLAVAVFVLIRRLRRSKQIPPMVEGSFGRDPVSWGEQAERNEREGNLREALRCRYRQTLATLAAGNLIEEIPGRTTGEYLRAVRLAVPAAGPTFATLTQRFEETWYGGRPVDLGALQEAKDLADGVARTALGRSSVRTPVGAS